MHQALHYVEYNAQTKCTARTVRTTGDGDEVIQLTTWTRCLAMKEHRLPVVSTRYAPHNLT